MYQGAQTNAGGARRASNAGRRSGRSSKRKRGRGRRRKNPTPTTWILIAGGVAVAAGGAIAYGLHRRNKKAALPPSNGPTPSGGQRPSGGGTRPGGGGTQTAAPTPFPFGSTQEAIQNESAAVATVFNLAMAEAGVGRPITESLNSLADRAFFQLYGIRKIPDKPRHAGWEPYVASWVRIRDLTEETIGAYNSGLASA